MNNNFILSTTEFELYDGINACYTTFLVQNYSDLLFYNMKITPPCNLNRWVKKRKADFLSGRWCVKTIMQNFVEATASTYIDIPIGPLRYPVWPDRFFGSITHSKNKAFAAIIRINKYRTIGVDLEHWINDALTKSLEPYICSKKELLLLSNSSISKNKFFLCFFSAKESLFKAVYPLVQKYFNFRDVEIKEICFKTKKLYISFKIHLSKEFTYGKLIVINFDMREEYVLTSCLLEE